MAGYEAQQLFDWVEHYERFGDHRTGSPTDRAVARWIAELLADLGLTVEEQSVPFERWICDSEVSNDGESIEHLAMVNEWTGELDTTNIWVGDLNAGLGGDPSVIDAAVADARRHGRNAAVLATSHPNGSLVGINRPLDRPPSGFPVFLVGGRHLELLGRGVTRVRAAARQVAGHTTNVVATNCPAGPRLMLATPLTGWFGCAGERGTGIAVLLDLVARLAADRPLVVVATGGHELGFFGARRWVEQRSAPIGLSSIVHVGASVAVEQTTERGRELIANRLALTSLSSEQAADIAHLLDPIGLRLRANSPFWIGEAEVWRLLGVPLLSITGAGADFHTPEDTAHRVTSPVALSRVADAMARAAVTFDEGARRGW